MSSSVVLSVLIIGGGATGSIIASTLGKLSKTSALWEKSTSTGRISHSIARKSASGSVADLGAQYFTLGRSTRSEGDTCLGELLKAGILLPMGAPLSGEATRHKGYSHLVAPLGAGSVIRYFRDKAIAAGVTCHEATRLTSLNAVVAPGAKEGSPLIWRAEAECGRVSFAHKVVLTVPAPQLPALQGDALRVALAQPTVVDALSTVTYDTRLALALFYSPTDAHRMSEIAPWTGHFIDNDPIVRYLSYETRKRIVGGGGNTSDFPCLVVHSTASFGALHETSLDVGRAVETTMMSSTYNNLATITGVHDVSTLPQPIETRVHRWRYAQVTKRANIPLTDASLIISNSPTLILAGDYLSSTGNFSGACESAADATKALEIVPTS